MTTETRHSPEPWSVEPRFTQIESQLPSPVAVCARDGGPSAADARRIVACVNACAGIPTEALEAGALAKALDAAVAVEQRVVANVYGKSPDDAFLCPRSIYDAAGPLAVALRALGRLP